MSFSGTESEFEVTTIERLAGLGFQHHFGPQISRDLRDVVLNEILDTQLASRYPREAVDLAIKTITSPQGVDPVRRNQDFLQMLTRGVEVPYEDKDKVKRVAHVHPIDWDNPDNNDFRVVNQLTIRGKNDRRPDIIVYINGLPLMVFELKSPYDEYKDEVGAYNQLGHYQLDIPQLFEYNAFCVVSDGLITKHGMPTAGLEWWGEWKSINGIDIVGGAVGSMKTLVEGLFEKERLLSYLRNFILFEGSENPIKKGAKYHQFFVVRAAAENAAEAFLGKRDNRLGVVWHTQGSGKSLEMVFLVGILRRVLNNPLIVVQVDAKALDEQIYGTFLSAKWLVGDVTQAETIKDLRTKLSNEAGQVIFTTLQKFDLLDGEVVHPEVTDRQDVIVIADEAHRSQYGLVDGMAGNIRRALPNAKFLGFTGTPIEFGDQDTRAVFGDYIGPIYDIQQAQIDKATVPIFYEARLAKLHLTNPQVDRELDQILEDNNLTEEEARIARWAQMEAMAGTQERVDAIAQDFLDHFDKRRETQPLGKAMIICMSRRNCVVLFDAIAKLRPEWADPNLNSGAMKIVMTNRPEVDPVAWNEAGHVTGTAQREHLGKRLKDEKDPLKVVIVRDMWLTGFDAPVLNTLYVDKPMKGHNLMQAIARVNRVFKDKPGGLIVDYIGIAEYLKEATARYTSGGGKGLPAPDIDTEGMEQFLERLSQVREVVPEDVSGAHQFTKIQLEDTVNRLLDTLIKTDELRDDFLQKEKNLTSAASLVSHLEAARPYLFETGVYQRIRGMIRKTLPGPRYEELDTAVKALVDKSVGSEEVVDIFSLAGLEKADISILDDNFLQEFANKDYPNLRLRLLEKLLKDRIAKLAKTNPVVARSFREMLENTLDRYHNQALDSAALVQAMIQMRKQMDADSEAKQQFGLSNEEVAFYDTLVLTGGKLYDQPFLAELVREIVPAIRDNLKPDWTRSSREDIQASIRSAVRRVLMRKGVKKEDFDLIIARIMEHAQAVYADWPQMPL